MMQRIQRTAEKKLAEDNFHLWRYRYPSKSLLFSARRGSYSFETAGCNIFHLYSFNSALSFFYTHLILHYRDT